MSLQNWILLIILSLLWGGIVFLCRSGPCRYPAFHFGIFACRVGGDGIIVGFAGVVVMMMPTLDQGVSLKSYGQLAVLGAALSYAFAGVWGKRLKSTPPLVNAAGMLICATFTMLPALFFLENPFALSPSFASWLAVGAIALLSTASAYILYFRILASAGATNLLLVTFLIPLSAMLLGMGILGERVETLGFYGMAVIFAGLILIDGRLIKRFLR